MDLSIHDFEKVFTNSDFALYVEDVIDIFFRPVVDLNCVSAFNLWTQKESFIKKWSYHLGTNNNVCYI
jgi:hypothetical protein